MVLSDGSVLVMGGRDVNWAYKNDVWKTVDGGASWILVTSSAEWTGKKILYLSNSLCLNPPLLGRRCSRIDATSTATVCLVSLLQM